MDSLRKSFKSSVSPVDDNMEVIARIDGNPTDEPSLESLSIDRSPSFNGERALRFSCQGSNFDTEQSNQPSVAWSSGTAGEDGEEKESRLQQKKSKSSRKNEESKPEMVADSFKSGTSSRLFGQPKSRLLDPSPPRNGGIEKISGRYPPRSGQIKSDMFLKSGLCKDDDDDPFIVDEEIPNAFKSTDLDFVTILQWFFLVLILCSMLYTFSIPDLRKVTLWTLQLWKWEIVGLVLFCGRLISGWVIRIIVFFLEQSFLLRKRVLYFVYGLRRAVTNTLWLGLVVCSWYSLFDEDKRNHIKPIRHATKILVCFLVTSVFYLGKTLVVKVMASIFHVSAYFDRIREALFHQYVIETLSGPPIIEMEKARDEEERIISDLKRFQSMGVAIPNELRKAALPATNVQKWISWNQRKKEEGNQMTISIKQMYKLNERNVSAWSMKRLIRIVRNGTLTTLDERIPPILSDQDESTTRIRSEYEAKIAAKKIFINVAKNGATYIYLSDLLRFMRQAEALQTLSLFEGAQENNRISKKSLKNWVVNAFRERKALSLTLNDTKTAVNNLNHMINVVVGVIAFVVSLVILEIAPPHFFALLGSQVLLAVFIFGNTLKTVFEAIVFVFVTHPFDVGDRCDVGGEELVVEEMNITTTTFLRPNNLKIIYPNNVLATKNIANYYRSPEMGDSIDFCVHVSTPLEKRNVLKERIINFVENKPEYWYPKPTVVTKDVDDMNRLKISISMRHRINHQDMRMRLERRELVVEEMIRVLRELEIEFWMLPLDVNVNNFPPATSSRTPSKWSEHQLT